MIFPYVKSIVYDGSPEEDIKRQERGLREGLKNATVYWQRNVAPRHFKYGAQGKYGYQQRSKKYRKRKEREGKGNIPLVYSGRTQEWVLHRFDSPRTRKTPLGITGALRVVVPKYFYMYRGAGPDKWAELAATIDPEYEEMFKIVDVVLEKEMNKPRRKRRVRVGNT